MIDSVPSQKRLLFSFLVARTHRQLVGVLFFFSLFIGIAYLFLLNRVALQGYSLTQEAQRKVEYARILENLDSELAQYDTREFLQKKTESGYLATAAGKRRFMFIRENFTARR